MRNVTGGALIVIGLTVAMSTGEWFPIANFIGFSVMCLGGNIVMKGQHTIED